MMNVSPSGEDMMKQQCTGYDSTLGMSRRDCLAQVGLGFGALALTDLVAGRAPADEPDRSRQGC